MEQKQELFIGAYCTQQRSSAIADVLQYTCTCTYNVQVLCTAYFSFSGICNVTKPCQNRGVCTNLKEDGGYWCKCQSGFTGVNCTVGHVKGKYLPTTFRKNLTD